MDNRGKMLKNLRWRNFCLRRLYKSLLLIFGGGVKPQPQS